MDGLHGCVLVVGDGDLAFSVAVRRAALAGSLPHVRGVWATTYEAEEELAQCHRRAPQHAAELQSAPGAISGGAAVQRSHAPASVPHPASSAASPAGWLFAAAASGAALGAAAAHASLGAAWRRTAAWSSAAACALLGTGACLGRALIRPPDVTPCGSAAGDGGSPARGDMPAAGIAHGCLPAGSHVGHGVDATCLAATLPPSWPRQFDCVVWNHPYPATGGCHVKENHALLRRFFASAGALLREGGQVRVRLLKGQGGTPADDEPGRTKKDSWQIVEAAAAARMVVASAEELREADYAMRGHKGMDKDFRGGRASVQFVLRRDTEGVKALWPDRHVHDINAWLPDGPAADDAAVIATAQACVRRAAGELLADLRVDEHKHFADRAAEGQQQCDGEEDEAAGAGGRRGVRLRVWYEQVPCGRALSRAAAAVVNDRVRRALAAETRLELRREDRWAHMLGRMGVTRGEDGAAREPPLGEAQKPHRRVRKHIRERQQREADRVAAEAGDASPPSTGIDTERSCSPSPAAPAAPPRRFHGTVAYDGTDLQGFQTQPHGSTVQDRIEAALSGFFRRAIVIVGSSRTDAGVHARAACFHFDAPAGCQQSADELLTVLQHSLPEHIQVTALREVPPDFHAHLSCTGKRYVYRVCDAVALPFEARWCWSLGSRQTGLDVAAMQAAAALLQGEHDFAAFCVPSPGDERSTLMRLDRCEVTRTAPHSVQVTCQARAFLYRQVRRIAGALVDVGTGQISAAQFQDMLGRGTQAGTGARTAPARGLCLEETFY
eukprot:TRINITY_DN23625_c0_g1_i1.p1 TRINITY_DN23625_c0_g1~~TRINITY_DN23625_c0_g1_i1.p1  ORF type:complete len:782 (+),score=157.31 TRINITY_DN23625_c0_g1_i1:67-2412(+)